MQKNVEGIYPLCPGQLGMLVDTLKAPDSGVCVVQLAYSLRGTINHAAFHEAWRIQADRHSILRTAFVWEGQQQPVQVVGRRSALPVHEEDWSGLPPQVQEQRWSEWRLADQRDGFKLSKAPLMRVLLVRMADEEHRLLWSFHHLVLDGWSASLVLQEFVAAYESLIRGEEPVRRPTIPFSTYLGWLSRKTSDQSIDFWRHAMQGFTHPTLPEIGGETSGRKIEGDFERQQLSMSDTDTAALMSAAKAHNLTLNNLFQGAFALVLSRYTGEREVTFGVTLSGRPHDLPHVESIVGSFINSLPMRVGVPDGLDLLGWLRSMQTKLADIQEQAHCSALDIQKWCGTPGSVRLFEVLAIFENYPIDMSMARAEQGLSLKVTGGTDVGKTSCPLTLIALPGRSFMLRCDYDPEHFSQAAIDRFLFHLAHALRMFAGILLRPAPDTHALSVTPQGRVGEIPLLSGEEREEMVRGWNETREERREGTVLDWIEAKAEERSGKVAVRDEQEELSYGELEERANRLGRYLRKRGVREESRVGIWMERGVGLMVGLLGIWKAGGAYVPLDRSYPRERVEYMVKDAGVEVVVSDGGMEWLKGIGAEVEVEVVNVEERKEEIGRESGERMERRVEGENAAYVIYTSGSTGKPKGAVNTQSGIANRLEWMQRAYGMGEGDRVLQKTTMSFDVSVWEFFWPLMSGAELVMARPGGQQDSRYLVEVMEREGITTVHFVPSMLGAWLEEEGVRRLRKLKRVVCSGEALSRELQEKFYARVEGAELDNLYGPTEAAVDVSYWKCEAGREVAIGRPIANTQLYVLDGEMEPVPVGVKGELYIGGAGLARGYWGKAELTAERFVPDPYGEQGERLYRTGDVARYRADGAIEYVGRRDEQVKIRGYRIELGEIEEALRSHAGVREAAVVVREEGSHKRLVGYVSGEGLPKGSGWREYLGERLPEYMLPSVYVELERMPLTANGKLNRRALPEPGGERPQMSTGYTPPTNERERVLAQIWSKVLGVDQIGIHDNFFALGGDSMRILQIRSLAKQQGIDLSSQQLFEHQTIYESAGTVTNNGEQATGFGAPPESEPGPFELVPPVDRPKIPEGVDDAYPILPLQLGMFFHGDYAPETTIYHDVFSYHLETVFDRTRLEEALNELTRRHPVLRTSFHYLGLSEPLQFVQASVSPYLEVFDLRDRDAAQCDSDIAEWIEEEKKNKFDWTRAPLLRCFVHLRTSATFQFTVSFHHAILDGWSFAAFASELFQRYLLSIDGAPLPILEPSAEFRHFVARQQKVMRMPESSEFWKTKLAGRTVTAIPRETVQGSQARRQYAVRRFTLPTGLVESLQRLTETAKVPLKSILFAAHLKMLGCISGNNDVLTGFITHGRESVEGGRTLGLFLNTVPFRQIIRGGTWIDLAQATLSSEMELRPYATFALPEIQKLTGGETLFDTAFNFTHFHVLREAASAGNIQVLGELSYDETNFTLLTNTSMNTFTREIQVRLDHDSSLISAPQIERLEGLYTRALCAMAEQPWMRHESLPLLSPEEKERLLVEWSGAKSVDTWDAPIHESFAAQVSRTPDAPAVVFEGSSLTYRQLDDAANLLAKRLQTAGAGEDQRVGICLERGIDMMIAVLGTLKSGAAYVALDLSNPVERLRVVLEESAPIAVVTTEALEEKLGDYTGTLVHLDQRQQSDPGPVLKDAGTIEASLAYVVYTSGSTGRPKGIGLSHGALSNLLRWYDSKLHSGARTLQFAALSFDVSFLEAFSTWTTGGTLYICTQEERRDALALLRKLSRERVQRAVLPVIMLQQIAEHYNGSRYDLRDLREVITTGEQLRITPAMVRMFEALPECTLENHYGPSEAHVVSAYSLPSDRREWTTHPPIGGPIDNLSLYVIDEFMQPAPMGTPGQLYIGGAGLARGYVGDPRLTATKFVPDPFAINPGARLYATGDLARWQAGGNIEFLGRMDHQIKIRGYRVELGEIESALTGHPSVAKAVVVPRGESPAPQELAAYLISETDRPSASELRSFLGARLPEYMLPSDWVWLDGFPLTANGKVDLRQLPVPDKLQRAGKADYVAARNALEELVADLWSEILDVQRVGVHDSFFDLGGDSLRASQVIIRLRDLLDLDIPVSFLFDSPTLAEFSARLEDAAGAVIERVAQAALAVQRMSSEEVSDMLLSERVAHAS